MKLNRLHRVAAAGCAILILACATAGAATTDPAKDPIASQAESAMWWGDIDALERLYAQAQSSADVNAWNGRTAVQSVRSGLSEPFKYDDLNGAYFREFELTTARWADERPDSVLAQLIYARALYARAWHIRGGGYWATVPEPAKAEFQRLIAKAERHIADRAPMLMKDITTHIYLLMIGRSASWTPAQLRAIADHAPMQTAVDRLAIHEEVATSLLPKWGGDWMLFAAYIDDAVRRAPKDEADELYAQLWSIAASNVQGNLFKLIRVDSSRVRQGFERLAARRSGPYSVNRLAYLACLAEDVEATRSALGRIDGAPMLRAWSGGGADGRQNYEACAQWAASAR